MEIGTLLDCYRVHYVRENVISEVKLGVGR